MDDKADVKKPQDARLAGSRADTQAEGTAGDRTVTEQPVRQMLQFPSVRRNVMLMIEDAGASHGPAAEIKPKGWRRRWCK